MADSRDKSITTHIDIRRAAKGYVVRHGYLLMRGNTIQAQLEDTMIFDTQAEMMEWVRKHT